MSRDIHRWTTLPVLANDKVERCSFPHCAFSPYPATVAVDNALHGCQTDAGPRKLASIVQPLENTEELVRVPHVEPCTVIANKVDHSPAFVLDSEFNTGLRQFGAKFPGIAQQ